MSENTEVPDAPVSGVVDSSNPIDVHATDRKLKQALKIRGPLHDDPVQDDSDGEQSLPTGDFLKPQIKPDGSWADAEEVVRTPKVEMSPEEIERLRLEREAEIADNEAREAKYFASLSPEGKKAWIAANGPIKKGA